MLGFDKDLIKGTRALSPMSKHVKLVSAFIAFVIYLTIHEGLHVVTSFVYGEFERFVIHPYGF